MNEFNADGLNQAQSAAIAKLHLPGVVDYFTRNPHRMAALRALLDLLAIPLPDWAKRDLSGRGAASRNLMAAFKADNPRPANYVLPPRKDNASPRPTT